MPSSSQQTRCRSGKMPRVPSCLSSLPQRGGRSRWSNIAKVQSAQLQGEKLISNCNSEVIFSNLIGIKEGVVCHLLVIISLLGFVEVRE